MIYNNMPKRDIKLPCWFMTLMVRWILVDGLSPDSHENRTRLGILAGWVSVVISTALAITKFFLGYISGSVSIIADATNNVADVGSSLMIALGFQWSRKPRDEEHPFGHGRIEAVATIVLAVVLLVVGIEVGKSGVMRLIDPHPVSAPTWLLVAVGVTLVVKTWMAIFARSLASLTKSRVLAADAWNHTFDIVCSIMVVLALVCSRMGWGALDGWTAVAVALFILYTGISYGREAIDMLLGQKPDPDIVNKIAALVEQVDAVINVHEIIVHHYGAVQMVSFHIEVDAHLSLVDAHEIAEAAEDVVEQAFGWRTIAHLDPVDNLHPFASKLKRAVKSYVASDSRVASAHDVRAEGEDAPFWVSFDLVIDMKISTTEYNDIYEGCLAYLLETFGDQFAGADIALEAVVESAPTQRRIFTNKKVRSVQSLRKGRHMNWTDIPLP